MTTASLWSAPDLESSPARRFTPFGRLAGAGTLVLGALFQVLAFATEPAHPETIDRLHWIAENEAQADLVKIFDFLAMPFLFGAVIVYVLLSRVKSPKLAYTGGVLLACGMLGLTAAHGFEILEFKLAQDGRFDLDALADAVDGASPPLIVMFLFFIPGAVFGLLTMTVALWRSGAVPRAPVLLIPVFIVLDIPLQHGLIAHAIALAGACWIASAVLLAGRTAVPVAYPEPAT